MAYQPIQQNQYGYDKPPPYNPQHQVPGAYPPPQPGYHPAPYQGYQQQGYAPHPGTTATTNVVVVGTTQPATRQVIVQDQNRDRNNVMMWHLIHLIITLIFWPWAIVWIIFCIVYGF